MACPQPIECLIDTWSGEQRTECVQICEPELQDGSGNEGGDLFLSRHGDVSASRERFHAAGTPRRRLDLGQDLVELRIGDRLVERD